MKYYAKIRALLLAFFMWCLNFRKQKMLLTPRVGTPEYFKSKTGSYFGQHLFCDLYAKPHERGPFSTSTLNQHIRLFKTLYEHCHDRERPLFTQMIKECPNPDAGVVYIVVCQQYEK